MRLDLRSLACFRIALGLLLFEQSILLTRDFTVFYETGNLCPPYQASSLLLGLLVFVAIPVSALALTVGFLTRLSTLLGFVSLVIVQDANPQILQGGDILLRLLLFWSLFLPLGSGWSIDSRIWKASSLSLPWTACAGTWAFILQVCFVYWFAALLKSDSLWTQNGNALFYALNIEHFTTPFGLSLRQYPELLRFMTFGTLGLEFIGPFLLFSPFYRDTCRLVAVILFMSFHLIGMQALLRIGLFPWVCAIAWLPFLPGTLWDRWKEKISVHRKLPRGDASPDKSRTFVLMDYGFSLLILAALLDVLAWNIASLKDTSFRWMKQNDLFGQALHLDQRWNMYAPHPRQDHGWLVVPGDLADGTQVDLFTNQPVGWDKPKDLGAYFGDDRWRRYLSNLFDQAPQALQQFAGYLVRRWNNHHDNNEKVQVVTIVFMDQTTLPDLTVTPPEKKVLYFQSF